MSKKNKIILIAILGLLFLASFCAVTYPLVSNQQAEKQKDAIVLRYQEAVSNAETIDDAIAAARTYNSALANGQTALADYGVQLDPNGIGMMGFVTIPAIGVELPIYHGTQSLELGAVHLQGTSLPVGGEGTHCVISAHSGMTTQKMFTDLEQLAVGDVFYLHILDETLAYQVDSIKTVLPYDTSLLGIVSGKDYCTLVSCTPYGINTHRLLVRGTRIPYEEAEIIVEETAQEEQPRSSWEEKYLLGLFLGVLAVLIIFLAAVILMRIHKRYIARQKSARRKVNNYAAK